MKFPQEFNKIINSFNVYIVKKLKKTKILIEKKQNRHFAKFAVHLITGTSVAPRMRDNVY